MAIAKNGLHPIKCQKGEKYFFKESKNMITLYVYGKCSTCKDAIRFLKQHGITFEQKEISLTPPSISELETMLSYKGNEVKKIFNTSGILYKEMQLKEKLKHQPLNESLQLLSEHGMLVKRPFLLGDRFGLLGFKEGEWLEKIPIMKIT